MLGARQSWRTVSYFFSDVFDLTFNVVGATVEGDERIVRGVVENNSFSVLYLHDNRLRGAFLLEQSLVEAKAAGALVVNRSDLAATKAALADSRIPLDRAAVQTVLILQGGGALGAFECGVVKALEERRIYPDLVAGVSIGAFNAAIIAGNPRNATAALEAFWRELSLYTPDVPDEETRRAVSSLQSVVFGAPNFFHPRWFQPVLSLAQLPAYWTSFYDLSPLGEREPAARLPVDHHRRKALLGRRSGQQLTIGSGDRTRRVDRQEHLHRQPVDGKKILTAVDPGGAGPAR